MKQPITTCKRCGSEFSRKPHDANVYCSTKCRLLSKVQINPNGCWEWTGCRLKKSGYGKLGVGDKIEYAHRQSWISHKGPIPDGHVVCHKCDNTRCINPDHLFIGTPAENIADMLKKDRAQRSRFTVTEVEQMSTMYSAGNSQRVIAEQFGISQSAVSLYLLGKRRLRPGQSTGHGD